MMLALVLFSYFLAEEDTAPSIIRRCLLSGITNSTMKERTLMR